MATRGIYLPKVPRPDASESEHENMSKPINVYSRSFNPKKQMWSLFRAQGIRLTLTGVLMALVVVTLMLFEHHGNVGTKGKRVFNFITTTLSLILGFNFFEAFKDMARILRWRYLTHKSVSVREADLILACENLRNVTRLMWEPPRKSLTVFLCILWIVLNVMAQASIATIGLTYSMETGTNSSGIITKIGNVNAPNLDCFYHNDVCATGPNTAPEVAQGLAHSYGETIRARRRCSYTTDSEIQGAAQDCYYFNNTNGQEFAIRYAEYNPDDLARAYPYFTDRIVKAFARECYQYNIDGDTPLRVDSNDGEKDVWVWRYYNSTFNSTISVPSCDGAFSSTTYIYNGVVQPQKATSQACGRRCLWLYALQNEDPLTKRSMLLFQCSISISEVSNARHDWQILPDLNARLAAASIGLTGRNSNPNGSVEPHWQQYQLYPRGSYWETQNLTAAAVGARMSEFAIGSLAAMADLNPQISGQGTVPILGFHLSVDWVVLIPFAAGVVAVHFFLVLLSLWIARPVVVPDDSSLCTAHLLHGLVARLAGKGSLLSGKELAKVISSQGTDRVAFGIRGAAETVQGNVLELGEHVKVREKGKKFPSGLYA